MPRSKETEILFRNSCDNLDGDSPRKRRECRWSQLAGALSGLAREARIRPIAMERKIDYPKAIVNVEILNTGRIEIHMSDGWRWTSRCRPQSYVHPQKGRPKPLFTLSKAPFYTLPGLQTSFSNSCSSFISFITLIS